MPGSRTARFALLLTWAVLSVASAVAQGDDDEFQWPKILTGVKGEIIVYQPQVESFAGSKLEARAAVSVKRAGEDQAKVDELSRYLEGEFPTWDMVLSIDRLLAALPAGEGGGGGRR